jgi:hypothetical protein
MRRTTLKRTKKGYVRSLGKRPDGSQPKFLLGHDKAEAERRESAIIALWLEIAKRTGPVRHYLSGSKEAKAGGPFWSGEEEAKAKAIARGEGITIVPTQPIDAPAYFERINRLRGSMPVDPAYPDYYEAGRSELMQELLAIKAQLVGEKNKHKELTGQTLFQAIEAFRQTLLTKDGGIKDGEKTLADQLKSVPSYLTDCDLGQLDFMGCDECYGTFRNRPKTVRYKDRMKRKSARNMISALNQFFKWLHLNNNWHWRKPEDFGEISKTIVEIEGDDEHDAKEHEVWTIEELRILYKYALPIERAFMLLGLNCSYGADQTGTLRESRVRFAEQEGKRSYIRRIRKKRGTWSVHLLFKETEKILRWASEHRKKTKTDSPYLLVNGNGQPYWYLTEKKNRSAQIPTAWNRLLRRVKKDFKKFRQLPFNSLRDTSSDLIEKMGGSDFASLHLAHKHLSGDKSLRNYVNPNRKKHFKLIRRLERKMAPIWEGVDPLVAQPKNYIGFAKIEEIKKLRADGLPQGEIVKKVGVSAATVSKYAPKFRHAKKRKPK